LHAVLGVRHDRGPRLDRAGARGVRLVAAVPPDDRRLSVRRHHHPAAARAGDRPRHPVATDVVAAVSGDHRGAGRDLMVARLGGQPRSGLARACVRTRPLSMLAHDPEKWKPVFGKDHAHAKKDTKRGMRAPQPDQLPAGHSERAMKKFMIAAAAVALAFGTAMTGADAQKNLKVAFIYVGRVGDMGWTYQHEVGRRAIQEQFKDKIDTSFLENVNEGPDAERSIEQLVRTGHKLIYTTSFGFMDATAKVAKKYPNVMFEH